jgi:hypothetical protein
MRELPPVGIFSSHVVPFSSGPGQVPGVKCMLKFFLFFSRGHLVFLLLQVGLSTIAIKSMTGVRH